MNKESIKYIHSIVKVVYPELGASGWFELQHTAWYDRLHANNNDSETLRWYQLTHY